MNLMQNGRFVEIWRRDFIYCPDVQQSRETASAPQIVSEDISIGVGGITEYAVSSEMQTMSLGYGHRLDIMRGVIDLPYLPTVYDGDDNQISGSFNLVYSGYGSMTSTDAPGRMVVQIAQQYATGRGGAPNKPTPRNKRKI